MRKRLRVFLLLIALCLAACEQDQALPTRFAIPSDTPLLPAADTPDVIGTPEISSTPTQALSPQPSPIAFLVLYTTFTVDVRACPHPACDILGRLARGQEIAVTGTETGQVVNDSEVWVQFVYHDTLGYVHSSLVSQDRPQDQEIPGEQAWYVIRPEVRFGSGQTPIGPGQPGAAGQTSGSPFTCNCNKTCGQITSCEEAYYQLNTCGCRQRDSDNDGVPCELPEYVCPGGD